MSLTYTAGSLVAARGREWVVLPESAPDMLVLRPLGGSEDDIAAVFPSFEEVRPAEFAAPSPADLGDQRAAGLLRTALRIGFRSGAGPFRSLASIAVEPRAYQLVPLLMALRQRTVRLLISDDVGIGKTVEAGLIAKELLAQGEATRLAVLCSPALAEQWQGELREKFGIDAELVLASTVTRLERGLELGQSLFDKHPYTIISTDFIKSTRHREDFIRHCPDLVIVDEAHTCVAADDTAQGGTSSAANQLRYELLRRISAQTDRHLLLLTATPHSGKESAFRNLLGLVRPELATLDLEPATGRAKLAEHFVARKRADVRDYLTKEDGLADDSLAERTAFPSDRWTKDEPYKLTPAYRALLDDAIAYARDRVTAAGEQGKREARIAWWSVIALLRSMVSSPAAAAQTLKTRSESATARTAQEADALGAPVAADSAENDRLEGMDVAPGAAESEEAGARLLELSRRAAQLVGPSEDAKLKALTRHLKGLIADGYHPIVFCRYIPTAEYLATQLEGKLGKKTKIAAVTGTLSPQQRLERIEQLAAESAGSAEGAGDPAVRRVLIATDCLSEGVNLQHYFDAVVHYDLAWNPTRHDQREGRVDRYGQKRDQVRVITMYGEDNGIDGKVLEVLFRKHRQIKKDLGISVSVPDETASGVTDAVVEWLLLHGRQGSQESLFDLDGHQESFDRIEREWNSAAEREKTSRSKYAQRAIHPEEVAREVAAVRAALGGADEVRDFALEALRDLDALVRDPRDGTGDFTAQLGGAPAGLRDALAATLGGRLIEEDREIPFRTTPAIARGEAALVRTDPAIGAIASYVLDSALDANTPGPRPARRCGVVTTDAVTIRTTLLLVRYRFHLTLPSRTGERQLVAEDARLLAYEGMPSRARWLDDDAAAALLAARATANTHEQLARNQITRALDGLPGLSAHLTEYGTRLAAELDASHRRVRKANEEIVRGLKVVPQEPADVLGVYVYLPQPASTVSGAEA
ncbi:DEAD/DEAH box helicase [Streptomyces luomodiensis]|uniref:DEAD/DEAH box helicase n=1 Tax=Streptomyces luomodiensis TaxID=3026192 RepID=A0ABY9V4Y8_9ACTN|nr:DEAD/DEAH box helicase [Streptomyces sp. SCA4-21]WNE99721.1 DEAD/DEAH box helicase [Streptomyces sp. SCA4-21]